MKKYLLYFLKIGMAFSLFFVSVFLLDSNEAEAASWKDLGSGWKYRVDSPLSDGGAENDYHVHVKGKVGSKTIESSETVNGDDSHKTNFNKSGVPKWVQKEVKETKEFKNAKKKQKQLEAERKKMSNYSWNDVLFNPMLAIGIATTVGVTVWTIISGGYKNLIFG